MRPLPLANPVVVITGASSGIGAALASAFARQGARLVLASRSAEQLEKVRQGLADIGCDTLCVPTDVRHAEAVQQLAEKTLARFGRVDILINNAGFAAFGPFLETSTETMREVF